MINSTEHHMIGERIKARRKQLGLTQTAIAKACSVSKASVSDWEKDLFQPKDKDTLVAALQTTKKWLLTGNGSMEDKEISNVLMSQRSVPLISWVAAGSFCDTGDSSHLGSAEDYYPGSTKYSSSTFALKIKGLSMYPKFLPGDVIYIDPEREAVNGSYVIIQQNNASETTFKQLKIIGDQKYLQAINQNIPDIPALIEMMPDASICGVVVARYEEFI